MASEIAISRPASNQEGTLVRWLERHFELSVIASAALIFFSFLIHSPALSDDVDAAHASIGRTMLRSGDWVTPRLDGVIYLEKSPFPYWTIALSFAIFGAHDWAARIPFALCAIALCWVTARFAAWAFGRRAGLYAGIALATCVGLFLFTRVLIPDVMLAVSVTVTVWAFLRTLDEEEVRPRVWPIVMGASLAIGLLIKGLIAVIAPGGGAFVYLLISRQLFSAAPWKRLRPLVVIATCLLITAPWYTLAILHNPPYFDFSFHSGPGHYRGFFWFYFINEHLLRFLNLRYPHDYNTVPRWLFWLLHLVWLFPWSVYFPAVARLKFQPSDRAGKVRLMALCWTGFLLTFFTFSTTQEYYSMPVYPALALLIGSAISEGGKWVLWGTRIAAAVATAGMALIAALLYIVRSTPTPGDVVSALTQHPEAYTLSLGHMQDLTLQSFAYFRAPLLLAGVALLIGVFAGWTYANGRAFLGFALMMVLFTHAAQMALVVMEPLLSSRALAEGLRTAPPGELIAGEEYYTFSSVFFYADRNGLLLNGRVNNLEYGSNAPGAPDVFIGDSDLQRLWQSPQRYYLLAVNAAVPRLATLVGKDSLFLIKESGGKFLFCNRPI